jgi:hypothetical protein
VVEAARRLKKPPSERQATASPNKMNCHPLVTQSSNRNRIRASIVQCRPHQHIAPAMVRAVLLIDLRSADRARNGQLGDKTSSNGALTARICFANCHSPERRTGFRRTSACVGLPALRQSPLVCKQGIRIGACPHWTSNRPPLHSPMSPKILARPLVCTRNSDLARPSLAGAIYWNGSGGEVGDDHRGPCARVHQGGR